MTFSRYLFLVSMPANCNLNWPSIEEQILAARFGIRSIPVQVFYDASGNEVFRHVGFFAQTEVDKQLEAMGVKK